MNRWIFWPTGMIGGLLVFLVVAGRGPGHPASAEVRRPAATVAGARTPVLVELFTSEGCSSCPPADKVLTELEKTQPVPGVEIIALSEHVDYWNRLGWADPYSSAEFSARQNAYSHVLKNDTIYTPQMIVDGRVEFVGSRAGRAREVIAEAGRTPKALVQVTPRKNPAGEKIKTVPLQIRVEQLPPVNPGDTAEVWLAITENDLHSRVARGENAGRALSHTAVVRQLRALGSVSAAEPFVAEAKIDLDRRWKPDKLQAVVFVQERTSRRVLGAAVVRLVQE